MKNETTVTEAVEYLEKHIDSTDVKATTNLKILSDFSKRLCILGIKTILQKMTKRFERQ